MKSKYIMLIGLIVTMMFASCGHASYLKSEKDAVSANVKGESGALALSSDGDIEVLYAPEWVTVELDDTTLNYTIDANKTNVARKGYVVLKSDTLNLAVEFNQCTRASYLFIPETKVTINKEGKGDDLEIITDGGNVKVDCPEGVTFDYYNGMLSFKSKGNTGQTKTSKVNVTCDDLVKEITIVQVGNICETCHGKGRVKCYMCDGAGELFCPYRPCHICHGARYIKCRTCGGTGK